MKVKKFLIALLLGVVMMFSFAGCNSGNDLQSKIDGLQSRIEELEEQLRDRDERIEQLENEIVEMQDYILKISADKEVYSVKEEILIDITLENRSGADVEIAYYSSLVCPDSPTGQFPATGEQSPITTKRIFKNGEIIRMTDRLGGYFPVGQHELKYRAVFYLSWETTEFGYDITDDKVSVVSNTINFSVTAS